MIPLLQQLFYIDSAPSGTVQPDVIEHLRERLFYFDTWISPELLTTTLLGVGNAGPTTTSPQSPTYRFL